MVSILVGNVFCGVFFYENIIIFIFLELKQYYQQMLEFGVVCWDFKVFMIQNKGVNRGIWILLKVDIDYWGKVYF